MASGLLTSADKLRQIAATYKTRLFPVEEQQPFRLINDFLRLIFCSPWLCGGRYFFNLFQETLTQAVVSHIRTDTHSQTHRGLHWWSLKSCNTLLQDQCFARGHSWPCLVVFRARHPLNREGSGLWQYVILMKWDPAGSPAEPRAVSWTWVTILSDIIITQGPLLFPR